MWLLAAIRERTKPTADHALAWRLGQGSEEVKTARHPRRRFSISARLKSFVFAGRGISYTMCNEHNVWIHCFALAFVVSAGLFLNISNHDWRWVALAAGLVFAAELFNTAIEAVCDLHGPAPNETIRNAKDVAAGAVLVAAMLAVVIAALTFAPYVYSEPGSSPNFCTAHSVSRQDLYGVAK